MITAILVQKIFIGRFSGSRAQSSVPWTLSLPQKLELCNCDRNQSYIYRTGEALLLKSSCMCTRICGKIATTRASELPIFALYSFFNFIAGTRSLRVPLSPRDRNIKQHFFSPVPLSLLGRVCEYNFFKNVHFSAKICELILQCYSSLGMLLKFYAVLISCAYLKVNKSLHGL